MKKDEIVDFAKDLGVELDPEIKVEEMLSTSEFSQALIKEVKRLRSEKETADKVKEELTTKLEVTTEALKEEEKKSAALDIKLQEQKELSEELTKEVKEVHAVSAKTSGGNSMTVKHGKKVFQITAKRFRFHGELKTAEDVKEDKELRDSLLKKGSGILVELKSE